MATVTDGVASVADVVVLVSSRLSRRGRTLVHQPLGEVAPDVTLRAAGPRAGTLEYRCGDRDAALAVAALHWSGRVVTLSDPDAPDLDMSYVVSYDGEVGYPESRDGAWVLSVSGVQEVAA